MLKYIKGQKRAINLLKTLIQKNRLPHALLFYGPEGVGKFTTAKEIVKFYNCKNPDMNKRGEDNCDICRRIDMENFPDMNIIRREITESKSGKKKEAKEIKIDQIKSLIKESNLKPFESKYKFFIIDGAESLNIESSNSLLKTLEEPRPDTYIILIVNNINKIIDTIYSRCVKIKFNELPYDIVSQFIKEEYQIDELLARKIALISNGSMSRVKIYLENDNYKNIFEIFTDYIELLDMKRLKVDKLNELIHNMRNIGIDTIDTILELLLVYLTDIYLKEVYNIDKEIFFKNMLNLKIKKINFKKYNLMLKDIILTKYELVNSNINVELLLKNLFLNIKDIIHEGR